MLNASVCGEETYRWDLSRYGYVFGEGYFSFFDRTVHIDVVDLFAEVCLGIYEADETVLDLKVYVCAFIDILGKCSNGLDSQILTSVFQSARFSLSAHCVRCGPQHGSCGTKG